MDRLSERHSLSLSDSLRLWLSEVEAESDPLCERLPETDSLLLRLLFSAADMVVSLWKAAL